MTQLKSVPDAFQIDVSIGNFRLLATDDPFTYEYVTSARIVLSKLEVRDTEGKYHSGPNREMELDLAKLRNGRFSILADFDLPPGNYTEVKLFVKEAMVELSNGKKFEIEIPFGAKTGVSVPLSPNVKVGAKGSADYLLDFDLSKSFLPHGDITDVEKVTGFEFFPVVRAANIKTAGAVAGVIVSVDKTGIVGALVEISNDKVTASAVTEQNGIFNILGLPPGDYKVTVKKFDHREQTNLPVSVTQLRVSPFSTVLMKMVP